MAAAAADQSGDEPLVRLLTCDDTEDLLTAAVSAGVPAGAPRVGALYRLQHSGLLRLSAYRGLRSDVLDRYRVIDRAADVPAALALRERRPVYSMARDLAGAVPAGGPRPPDVAFDVAALPLVADDDVLGSLCLVLPSAVPGGWQQRLTAIATVCAHRWRHLLSAGEGTRPESAAPQDGHERAAMLDLAMSNAGIGSFDWDFASGHILWDERMCALFGVAPEDFDGRIETFRAALHPQDRRMVEAAEEESLHTGRYHVMYRVVLPGGRVRWIDAESRVVFGSGGRPQGMIGVAKDRTEERERESERWARRRLVLDLSRALSAAVTTEEIVAAVNESALPAVGASAVVLYVWEGQGPLRLIGSQGFGEAERRRLRQDAEDAYRHPLLASLWDGDPLFVESRREWAELMPGGDLGPLPGRHAWALLPLTSASGLVGLCSFVFDQPRSFAPDDRTVFTAAAGTLAQALSRARHFDAQRRYLTELQRLMLPHPLPDVPGLDIAVGYHPSSEGMEVGGDWYDVVPLPGRRAALIIGDVEGHSAQAAAVMGQLRRAMRTYALEGHGPADLLEGGAQALHELDTDLFATCCIAEIDHDAGRARLARAGHPLPLLLEPGGRVREVAAAGGLPLGTFASGAYPVTEAPLAPGATLLLYTDGLVESPGRSYDDAVTELSDRLARWSGVLPAGSTPPGGGTPDLDAVADRIAAPAAARSLHDDIALLLARVTAA